MTIRRPVINASRAFGAALGSNSATEPYTWEQHAKDHAISVDEMKAMYLFARETLYARFKSRLRDRLG